MSTGCRNGEDRTSDLAFQRAVAAQARKQMIQFDRQMRPADFGQAWGRKRRFQPRTRRTSRTDHFLVPPCRVVSRAAACSPFKPPITSPDFLTSTEGSLNLPELRARLYHNKSVLWKMQRIAPARGIFASWTRSSGARFHTTSTGCAAPRSVPLI